VKETVEYLESFVVLALTFAGLTGIAYHMFREGGWVETMTGSFWNLSMRSPLMALAVVAGSIALGFLWQRTRMSEQQQGKAATVVFYVAIAAGMYFLGHLAIQGSL
jgi:hypothetical protein